MTTHDRLRFAVIGANHGHIDGIVATIERGGGVCVAYHVREPDLADAFGRRWPAAQRVHDERAILDDPSIALVASAAVPDERAALGIRVMRAGKDFVVDKPGAIALADLAELRRVQRETGRIWSVVFGERLESPATLEAIRLVRAGAIGDVASTVGLGPHRLSAASRPAWFWERARSGGILCDIGAHQFDQFLAVANTVVAEVVTARVANLHHAEHAAFEDFGDVMLRAGHVAGYAQVNWFTPPGMPTWGDTRLTIYGSLGTLEVRKNVDVAGRAGGEHLFLADGDGVRYIECAGMDLPYGRQLVHDVLHRTETAMSQAHSFAATELALHAQQKALD